MAIYEIDKKLGETPLEAIERTRKEESVPLTYAGRLDPAAEGKLLVFSGEDCKKKDDSLSLSKTYYVEIVLGVDTDTHDLLGIPLGLVNSKTDVLKTGEFEQQYPIYSSKTVNGIPLHQYAREGKEVELPTHTVTVHSMGDIQESGISKEEILERVGMITSLVQGDFRQGEIIEKWSTFQLPEQMKLISFEVTVSGGFYVRQLAHDMGGCLFSLVRTGIERV